MKNCHNLRMPLQDWFDKRVHALLFHNLGYQVALPIMAVLYFVVYVLKVSKEQPLKPTLQPHQTTTMFVLVLLMGLTFVSIGLWILQKEFWVFVVMQVVQLCVYAIFAFSIITFAKTPRIFCMKFEVKSDCAAFTVRFVTALSHAVLGLTTMIPMSLCALIIDSSIVEQNMNRDFSNMLDVAAGGCFYVFLCHGSGCVCELGMGMLGMCVRRRESSQQKHIKYTDNGVQREVSYDLSDENL